jgi:hypothetical protein
VRGTGAVLGGLHGARGTATRRATGAGELPAQGRSNGSARHGEAVAVRHGRGRLMWQQRREAAASARVDSLATERISGFRRQTHERRWRCSPFPAARPESGAAAAGAGSSGDCQLGGAAAASCQRFFVFYLIGRGGSRHNPPPEK